jgi:3-dehydro-L-gulonate 2-dehydrogenase
LPDGYSPFLKIFLCCKGRKISRSRRALSIGYWKGTGLSILLDILATVLSAGISVCQVSRQEVECGLSQIFIAFNLQKISNFPSIDHSIREIISDLKNSIPDDTQTTIRYPGERVITTRRENLANGIPVNEEIWKKILLL